MLTVHEVNEYNRRFWEEENAARDRRIADEDFRVTAFARLSDEQARRVLLKSQLTLEQALADAERDKKRILSHQGRKGGRAKKPDALRHAIEDLVRHDPRITLAKVREMLTKERYPGLIDDVDEDTIWFVQPDGSPLGRLKGASISGLKDRLSRAKNALKSR
jgi:hypothetical protein